MKSYAAILLVFSFFVNPIFAQENKTSVLTSLGITTPVLDNGVGLHLGVNPSYQLTEHFSVEGQISYLYTRIGSSFLAGETGFFNSMNALAGGRLYLNSKEKEMRFYVNLLAGLNYIREEQNELVKNEEATLGYSTGAYMELNRVIIGLSYDTPQNLVLKFGYSF